MVIDVSVLEYETEVKDTLYGPEKGKVLIVEVQLLPFLNFSIR